MLPFIGDDDDDVVAIFDAAAALCPYQAFHIILPRLCSALFYYSVALMRPRSLEIEELAAFS